MTEIKNSKLETIQTNVIQVKIKPERKRRRKKVNLEVEREEPIMILENNSKYKCYPDFEVAFNNWCEAGSHPMVKRDSRKSKDLPLDKYPYRYVTFKCIHHGKAPRITSKNIRPNQKYNARDCQVKVNLCLKNKEYKVTKMTDTHNHEVDSQIRNKYPDKRRLNEEELVAVEELMDYRLGTKELKEIIKKKFKKEIISQDIQNIRHFRRKKLKTNAPETEPSQPASEFTNKQSKTFMDTQQIDKLHLNLTRICTNEASKYIFEELNRLEQERNIYKFDSDSLIVFQITDVVKEYRILSDFTACTCTFYGQYALPCRHLFYAIESSERELKLEALIPVKWTKKKIAALSTAKNASLLKSNRQAEQYAKAKVITDRLATHLASCNDEEFDWKLNQLKRLLKAWQTEALKNRPNYAVTEQSAAELPASGQPQTTCDIQANNTALNSFVPPILSLNSNQGPTILTINNISINNNYGGNQAPLNSTPTQQVMWLSV